MARHIVEEAKRCLQCKKPLCVQGCPVATPVSEMVKLLLDGEIESAGKMLFSNNPLSIICSLVCPHELQCEGHCILAKKGNPVQISTIENYISDYYLNLSKVETLIPKDPSKKVAIIGSGPAGITIAIVLALRGFDITIFEAHDRIGGVLRYGIPAFRLPKEILDRLSELIVSLGVKIKPNTLIGPYITVDDLFRDGYKAVFIGTGVWNPRTLKIKGESLGHVHFAIDYLKNPDVYKLGKRVVIIGAGNVAMDVARTAIRHGAKDVIVTYRKGEQELTARTHEIEFAKIDGVKFEFYRSPIEIVDSGVIFERTQPNEDGTDIEVIDNSAELMSADSVIIAISQGPRKNIVANTTGIETNTGGLIAANNQGETTREGVFAGGDIVTGAKTVVEAVNRSKEVADKIAEYVNALPA